jgi:hypothetical protein
MRLSDADVPSLEVTGPDVPSLDVPSLDTAPSLDDLYKRMLPIGNSQVTDR